MGEPALETAVNGYAWPRSVVQVDICPVTDGWCVYLERFLRVRIFFDAVSCLGKLAVGI